ncbi:phosphoadenosine phosphosulfate reductase family protein [Neptuniibacter sp. QD37_11]|uniref:phosphoadenosine phosphosulfate reductase domain-containing protein n=1 Tax=Neptuniibacter sp. QD37_11 TaxID=3398209 RepID=UPI0039F52B8B
MTSQLQDDLFAEFNRLPLVDALFDPERDLAPLFNSLDIEDKAKASMDVIKHYLAEGYALCVAWSGGKDSSVMLMLALNAMREFVEEHGLSRCPQMVVLHGDTLVENPVLSAYAHMELAKIRVFAAEHGLPVEVEVARPNLSQNYLVNIIGGRSTASVVGMDRACADNMKVKPVQRLKKRILKRLNAGHDGKVITLVGKRYDESDYRRADMLKNGERPDEYVERKGEKILSSIAHFTLDDIFFAIGYVRSNKINTYSSFDELVEVYRGANGGECMVNAVDGKAGSAGCGARFGCWICLQVNDDKSMAEMLTDEQYAFMRPLMHFRNYLQAEHDNPNRRNWLSRSLNKEGEMKLALGNYSPEFQEELLTMALSIQIQEEEAAAKLGIEPRFTVLTLEEVIAIDVLWGRYGLHKGLQALKIYNDIYNLGESKLPPEEITENYDRLKSQNHGTLVYTSPEYNSPTNGFRDSEMMTLNQEVVVEKNGKSYNGDCQVTGEFEIHNDYLAEFMWMELDRALNKYNTDDISPTAAVQYLMRFGIVSIAKGQHSNYDRMFRLANQAWRLGLRHVCHNVDSLVQVFQQEGYDIVGIPTEEKHAKEMGHEDLGGALAAMMENNPEMPDLAL